MPDADRPRHYRKKPLAVFEHGTRIYAPSGGERRYRVVAADPSGARVFRKLTSVEDARAKARELEAYLAAHSPICTDPDRPRNVAAPAEAYLDHLSSRSLRYQERQQAILGCWVLPRLGAVAVSAWTPADSEQIITAARARLAPATVQGVGSVLRSLVTFAHKSRRLPREVDPMWGCGTRPEPSTRERPPASCPAMLCRTTSSAPPSSTRWSPQASRPGRWPCAWRIAAGLAGAS